MKHTDRSAMVNCPACEGECGKAVLYGGMYGSGEDEEWEPCETCDEVGKVQRVERLAWLIGEARELEARLAPLTMPVVVREMVAA